MMMNLMLCEQNNGQTPQLISQSRSSAPEHHKMAGNIRAKTPTAWLVAYRFAYTHYRDQCDFQNSGTWAAPDIKLKAFQNTRVYKK